MNVMLSLRTLFAVALLFLVGACKPENKAPSPVGDWLGSGTRGEQIRFHLDRNGDSITGVWSITYPIGVSPYSGGPPGGLYDAGVRDGSLSGNASIRMEDCTGLCDRERPDQTYVSGTLVESGSGCVYQFVLHFNQSFQHRGIFVDADSRDPSIPQACWLYDLLLSDSFYFDEA